MSVEQIAAEFTIRPVVPDHNGRCYELSAKRVAYGDPGATLVHGTVEGYGRVLYHAWVVQADGAVYEPTTDTVYTERAYAALFNPTVIASYDATETRAIVNERYHFGPWARAAWEGDGFEEANGEWED